MYWRYLYSSSIENLINLSNGRGSVETQAKKLLHMLRKTDADADTYTLSFVYEIRSVFIENIPTHSLCSFSLKHTT